MMSSTNILVNFIEKFFVSLPEKEIRTKFTSMGIEEDNVEKLMDMIKHSRDKYEVVSETKVK